MGTPFETKAALLRRIEENWRRHDVDGILADLDPEIEINPVPELSGPFKGHEGVRRYVAEADRLDELHFDLQELRESGDRIVILGRYRTRRGGAIADNPAAWVITVRNGKVRRSDAYASWREALDAVTD